MHMINVSRTRPLGITIIAIIAAIHGILGIIGGMTLMGSSMTFAVIAVVLGILDLILAWGLWTLQRWAFWATVVIEILALLNGIFGFSQRIVSGGIVDIVIALVVLIYLFADPNVRAAFRT
jgi:uncharacterized membrane protein (DUF2068 family)